MSSIYQDIILDHYRNPRNFRTLDSGDHIHVDNPLCGDSLDLRIIFKDGKVEDVGFIGAGCVLSLASASLLTEAIKGKSRTELSALDPAFVLQLTRVQVGPTRLKCVLLPLEALKKITLKTHE